MKSPPAFLATAKPPEPPADQLATLRNMVAETRDLEAKKADLEEGLKATNIALNTFYRQSLPDLFDAAGINQLTIEKEGNHPAIDAKASAYYKANIPADWPEPQRREAFDYLEANASGDLIKTTVTVFFPREKRDEALTFSRGLAAQGLAPVVGETVPWSTLTAWLKEQVEKHGWVPDLEKIGGTVGRIVKLKTKGE